MRISDWSSDVCSSDLDTLQPQKTCPVMPRRRQVRLQPTHQRQSQGTDHPRDQVLPEQRLNARADHGRQALAGLKQNIADKTVTHHHIRFTPVQPGSEEHTSELQSLMRISYTIFSSK